MVVKKNGIYVTRVFVFSSNINVWLHSYWTEKELEIIKPTDKVIKRYNEQKNLKWGYYYSKKTLDNYYDNEREKVCLNVKGLLKKLIS